MCGFLGLDQVQEGQMIGRQEWSQWDAEQPRELPVGGVQTFPNSVIGSDTESESSESIDGNIDSNSEYDLESVMSSEGDSFDWENYPIPDNMDELRAELLTPRGMSMSPVNTSNVHVPADYMPASPIYSPYSPTSPDYSPNNSPSMSPDPIDTDSSIAPSTSSNGIISTRDCDMFDMSNTDSDQDLEGEAETISLVGELLNQGKLPVKLHGIFIFPQPTHVHNLTWDEYPFEPCESHCVMPDKTDKSIAKFYLTHSLCLKHRSSLTKLGPWIYLSNRVTTLAKLHKSPQIAHFLSLLHGKMKGDQRVRDYLVVCQLTEAPGMYNLVVRVDLFLTNNPLEFKTFTQIYNLNDHVYFGDQMQFYIVRDFVDRIHDLYIH